MSLPPLDYHGRPMEWLPTRVHSLTGGAPCASREPPDFGAVDIRRALADGYGLLVELQPGDATRYSLVLSPCAGGFCVTATGHTLDEPVRVRWDSPLAVSVAAPNRWTRTLLEWWVLCLVEAARPA